MRQRESTREREGVCGSERERKRAKRERERKTKRASELATEKER